MNFAYEIVNWYHINKRDMPWRQSNDAYVIWLSEIILQQTRVEQGTPYFYRFLEMYPNVSAFAKATEEEILKIWQGLGYYSRGRNMLKTAKFIYSELDGVFPTAYAELIRLKGIGSYTAAAISSFAANEPKAVVDGNVYRVLARWFGVNEPVNSSSGKKIFQDIADEQLNQTSPGLHNQAIMEFGALMCKPKNPQCNICPIREGCYAFNHDSITLFPVKLKKNKVRNRYFNYFIMMHDQHIILRKRGEKDIWANMYDFPLLETSEDVSEKELQKLPDFEKFFKKSEITGISLLEKTMLTHQQIFYRFVFINWTAEIGNLPDEWVLTHWDDLKRLPMPNIISLLINKIITL
ncbi:MAG: A/G-specific adenine glycosylase [Sphingobacteriaceae bacterium]